MTSNAVNEMCHAEVTYTRWKRIPGFPGYWVSEHGSVSSAKRRKGMLVLLKPCIHNKGYLKVTLYGAGGVKKQAYVHRLVLEAFGPPCPSPQHQACHRDGVHSHNHVDNLYWGTAQENATDNVTNGAQASGERHGRAKLTLEAVCAIRMLKGRMSGPQLARAFGVSRSQITAIWRGEKWKE